MYLGLHLENWYSYVMIATTVGLLAVVTMLEEKGGAPPSATNEGFSLAPRTGGRGKNRRRKRQNKTV